MTSRHNGGIPPGETALTDQIHACTNDITLYWQQATDIAPAPDLAAAYTYTVTSLMAARELLFRAQALLMAIETVTS